MWAVLIEDKRHAAWNEHYWLIIEAKSSEEALQMAQEKIEKIKAENKERMFFCVVSDEAEKLEDGILIPAFGG